MARRSKELRKVVVAVLAEFGVTEYRMGQTPSGHQYVAFEYGGTEYVFQFSLTPGCVKAEVITRTALRRLLRAH